MSAQDINNTNFDYNLDYFLANVRVNAGNTVTCQLPDITDQEGVMSRIKFDPTSGALGTVSILPFAGQTIENAASKSITFVGVNGGFLTLYAHGTNWIIMGGIMPSN